MLNLFDKPFPIVSDLHHGNGRLVQTFLCVSRLLRHFLKPGKVNRHKVAAMLRLLAVLDPFLFKHIGPGVIKTRQVLLLKRKAAQGLLC